MIRFQVNPDKAEAFEQLIAAIQPEQEQLPGCGCAVAWLFAHHEKEIMRLLICPFDLMNGYSL